MMKEKQPCALCLEEKELRRSHIVPAFAVRYLKATSATGHLRSAIDPDLRRQDLETTPLLCHDCEQVISASERQFSLLAFPLVQDDNFREFEYGPWLLRFAVSLSWRMLVTWKADVECDFPQFRSLLASTLEGWRLFLGGERKSPGTEHHLFVFAGIPTKLSGDLHPKLLHYVLRSIDATPVVGQRCLAGYVKMLRSLFYSPILPHKPSGWKQTRIHAESGRLMSAQEVRMRGFGGLLDDRIREAFATPLSEAQINKINKTVLKDPNRALSSESYKVHRATRSIFQGREQK
jgi:hypothetical protein